MAFIPFTNVAKMELIFTGDFQTMENVLYYQAPGALDAGQLEDAAAALQTAWSTTARPKIAMTVALIRIKGSDMTSQDGATVEVAVDPALAGTQGEGTSISATSALIKFTTAKRGRSYRGRLYIVGVDKQAWTDNALTADRKTAYQDFAEALMSLTVNGQVWPLVIASRQLNGVKRVTGHAEEVIGAEVMSYPVTQRRRLPGHGA